MKRIILLLTVFAALTVNMAIAQYGSGQIVSRTYEPGIFSDGGGEYRWQIIERRVWVPEYQSRGILGIGSRTVPAHYEMRTDRIKIYTNRASDYYKGDRKGKGKHPHGMPPGQRKKL